MPCIIGFLHKSQELENNVDPTSHMCKNRKQKTSSHIGSNHRSWSYVHSTIQAGLNVKRSPSPRSACCPPWPGTIYPASPQPYFPSLLPCRALLSWGTAWPVLNFTAFLPGPFSLCSSCPWMAHQPSSKSTGPPWCQLQLHCIFPSSGSLIKTSNRSQDRLCRTPAVTHLQVGHSLLTMTVWAVPSN